MSGNQSQKDRRDRRAQSRREEKHGGKFPELVGGKNDLDAHLEREMNKVRFGPLEPRNESQSRCINMMDHGRLCFLLGPAGTGKTFLSVSMACEMLEAGEIERIIITRPMVGCDEEIGFLPGTEWEKFQAWVGPALEVLEGKLGASKVESYVKFKKIIGKPLMMMRGATFRDAFVIMDEAQNSTPGQMKMFLTRIGAGSKVAITGDLKQSDRAGDHNGLQDAVDKLHDCKSVQMFEFDVDDIERDPLVRDVVLAYRDK